jgi:hypothetical protein
MRFPAALCPQCHGAQPTAPGVLAKAVFVAIACVETIILYRLRKLVCTVSCCGALKRRAMPPGGRRVGGNCISTIIILCYVTAVPISP